MSVHQVHTRKQGGRALYIIVFHGFISDSVLYFTEVATGISIRSTENVRRRVEGKNRYFGVIRGTVDGLNVRILISCHSRQYQAASLRCRTSFALRAVYAP